MPQRILVAVAWPYANGSLHLGHPGGFATFQPTSSPGSHRLKGDEVLMVSGSDQHGTPITIRAEQEGITPGEVVGRYHAEFMRSWQQMGISFDLFTATGTDNHRQGRARRVSAPSTSGITFILTRCAWPSAPTANVFFPTDTSKAAGPHCSNSKARGDQCDNCGKTLNPEDLLAPRCQICGTTPEFRQSEHFFLRLSAFQKPLLEWVRQQGPLAWPMSSISPAAIWRTA